MKINDLAIDGLGPIQFAGQTFFTHLPGRGYLITEIDVSDAEILEAKAVIDASGVGCEPASAASVAGVRKLAREGTISAGDRVVAVLTGHILKDPGILLDYHKDAKRPLANAPIEIDAEVGAVERVLTEAASTWRHR